jgi:hypothetical protein
MPRFPYLSTIFLLLALLVGAVIVPNTVQILPPSAQIEADLSARFGGAVRIDGPVRLRFVPRPQVIVDKVSFSDNRRAEARFAAAIPRLVVDLNIAEMVQRRFAPRAVTALDADIQVQLAERPAALLVDLNAIPLPQVNIRNSDFRIIGIDPLRPAAETVIRNMTVRLAALRAGGPMVITAQKLLPNGQMARLRMAIGVAGRATEFGFFLGLGIDEQLAFNGFLSGSASAWRLDGEVQLLSDNFMADAIEARLPVKILPEGRRFNLAGLVRGSPSGLRSDSLEVEALNTVFRARTDLNWPRREGEVPVLNGRMSTGAVNLDLMRPHVGEKNEALLTGIWGALAPSLAVSMAVEATRFTIGGETGSDLSADFEQVERALTVQRLNLNLPFGSSLLASGRFDLAGKMPRFDGNFSARSSDTLALLLWLGSRNGLDFSAFAETVNEAQIQRASLVGDVALADGALALRGLAGRIGGDYFSAEIELPDLNAQQADIVFNISRLDLADWGVVDGGTAQRDGGLVGVWPQLDLFLADFMGAPDSGREIDFDIRVGRTFFEAERIGPSRTQGNIQNQTMRLEKLHLSNFENADIRLAGALNFDATPSYGRLSLTAESDTAQWLRVPVFERFAPLDFNSDVASQIDMTINLTPPNAADWPKVFYAASGRLDAAAFDFAMATPARSLTFSDSGTEINLSFEGGANRLAELFFLPAVYADKAAGAMQLTLAASGNDLFSVATDMSLAEDNLSFNGTLRAAVGGQSLSGSMEFNLAQFLPLWVPEIDWAPVAASGTVQLTTAPQNISFSGLDMNFSGGHISGEGVLQSGAALPQLNMNIAANDVDLSWLLPQRIENKWSAEDMRWSLLGRGNAAIELRATNTRLGELVLDGLDGRLKLTEGVLEAPDMSGTLLGGRISANVLAEGGLLTPRFALDAQFNDINPRALIAAHYGNGLIDAALSGALRLEGRGASLRAVMGGLGGEVNFEIAPGELSFFDAVGFAEAVRAPDFTGDASALVKEYSGTHRLSFARGLGRANMREGVIETASSDFVFADGLNEARLEGVMDMVGLEVDATFALYPSDRQKPVLWQITGTMENPDLKADASAFNPTAAAPSATPPRAE